MSARLTRPVGAAAAAFAAVLAGTAAAPPAACSAGAARAAGAGSLTSTWTGAVDASWTEPMNWSPSTAFPNNGGGVSYDVVIDLPAGLDALVEIAGGITIDGLAIGEDDRLDVLAGAVLRPAGPIANDGRIGLQGPSSQLDIAAPLVALGGTGELVLDPAGDARVRGLVAGHRLQHGPGHVIRGGGRLGQDVIALDNAGRIVADGGGTLVVDPAGDDNTSSGILRAEGGGVLVLKSGDVDGTGGRVEAAAGSQVRLEGGGIVGGELATEDDGVVAIGIGNGSLAELANHGRVEVENGRTLLLAGTITNDGTIATASTGTVTRIRLATATVRLVGGGELRLGGDPARDQLGAGGDGAELVNGPRHALRGAGRLGTDAVDLVNQGLIEADVAGGTLTIDPAATLLNTGTLRVVDGATIAILSGAVTHAGELLVDAGGTMERTGTIEQTGGTTAVDGLLTFLAGGLDLQGGVLRGEGTIAGPVTAGGTVAPGAPGASGAPGAPGASLGTLTVDGTYQPTSTAVLVIDVDGGSADRLVVTGTASLDGELRIEVAGGTLPPPGTSIVVLEAAAVHGTFTVADCADGYRIEYGDEAVTIVVTEGPVSPADLDCDGLVDFDDLLVLLQAFGDCPGGGVPCRGDVDGSGEVDFPDLLTLLSDWG